MLGKHKKTRRRHRSFPRRGNVEQLETRKLLAAEVLQVAVENLSPDGGLAQTPFWVAFHDGGFDIGSPGESAADFPGLEALAEEGDVSGLIARFAAESTGNDGVVTAPAGFPGAPVFEPGETDSIDITVDDTSVSRYFSYASMIIPSNDALIGNLDPHAIEVFDAGGNFLGPRTIVVYGSNVYDAGTEVNDPVGGAAFSTGGGTSVDENGVIHLHTGLDDFIGTGLPTGEDLESAFNANTPLARITLSLASAPSLPIDDAPPMAHLEPSDLNSREAAHEIRVTYTDASGVDPTSISTNDIRVTSPFLTTLNVISATTDAAPGTTPRTVTATYQVTTDSGNFTSIDNGTYSVVLNSGEVGDTFGQTLDAQLLGQFDVDIPVRLQVTIESLSPAGGLGQTPFWIGAHDGNFEVARAGASAAGFGGLESLAEEGDVSGLVARFASESNGNDSVITSPAGFPGAPVFEPGESVSAALDVVDPQLSRYFSFASMIIPSNDAFIGNLDPRQYQLFDSAGNFTGAQSITIYGQDVWDAGTEVNDPAGGAAFSTEGGTSSDEGGVVHRHEGLDDFVGTGLPTGANLQTSFGAATPLARITISLIDQPSDPIDHRGPMASADVDNVMASGTTDHTVEVTYSDASGIDITSIDTSNIEVVSGFNPALVVTGVTIDAAAGTTPTEVTATYQISSPSGEFNPLDNGVYRVNVVEDSVTDTLGNGVSGETLAQFNVLVGVRLQVTVENLSPDGGLYQTPLFVAFHEGNFDIARLGRPASEFPGLEEIAEEGDASVLAGAFAGASNGTSGVITAPGGFPGAPIFDPGEMVSQEFDVFSTDANRFFSFASMLIPSNDAFFANLNPRQYEVFDESGAFLGSQTITLYGSDVWDAGTEVNDPAGGAAFSTGGGTGVDEGGVIHRSDGLDDFIGTGLPTGENLQSAFDAETPLARITINLAGASNAPIDTGGPIATLVAADDVTVAGTPSHQIQVTYDDPSGIDLTRIGENDLHVEGPLGQTLVVTDASVSASSGDDARSVTVTYTLETPDGEFTARNNGRYLVSVGESAVYDTLDQPAEPQIIGDFNVNVGVRLQIQIESLAEAGGLGQTPFFIGLHDGSFEVGRAGVSAADFGGLELIAEEGDPSALAGRFAAEGTGVSTVITSPEGFPGAPVFEPGETVTQLIEVTDPNINQFLSYASMIIPSNDAFIANLNPRAYQLFDDNGFFEGARSFTITAADVWDAGTEVNDPSGGAAFSTGGGASVDEGGVIRRHEGLDDFIGTGLPTGENLASALDANMPLARITVTLFDPEAAVCSGVLGSCSVRSVGLQNTQTTFDVDDNGNVQPLDALLIINFLNRFGITSSIDHEARSLDLFLDVSGDDMINVLDAVQVLNELNRQNLPAEPEQASVQAAALAFQDFDTDEMDEELLDDLALGINQDL